MTTTVVASNPKPGSRTLDAATRLAEALTGSAPDLLLKTGLVELGATCPLPGLYLIDSTYTSDSRIADYTQRWAPTL